MAEYVDDLPSVIDIDAIRAAGVRIGADPLGGASVAYFKAIAERHGLDLTVVNDEVDPTFRFVPLDHDGKIRMDCSSPYAMAGLIELRDRFDVAVACDPDADRHGIVTPGAGLLNPNHYLAVAIQLPVRRRARLARADRDRQDARVELDDRPGRARPRPPPRRGARGLQVVRRGPDRRLARLRRRGERRRLVPAPRRHAVVDGQGRDPACAAGRGDHREDGARPGRRYAELTERFGAPAYRRVDSPVTAERKQRLLALEPADITASELAGEPIEAVLTRAPGNGAPIGGVKVVAEHGWFAARPSGTEDIYKLYAESFRGEAHLEQIIVDAQEILG